jgi:ABC-type nitrate/sulfonate/bicarbonate transport system ATPase subunit
MGATSHHAIEFWYKNKPEVIVVTHAISDCAHVGLSAVSMQARDRSLQGKQVHRDSDDRTDEMPMKRFSTR